MLFNRDDERKKRNRISKRKSRQRQRDQSLKPKSYNDPSSSYVFSPGGSDCLEFTSELIFSTTPDSTFSTDTIDTRVPWSDPGLGNWYDEASSLELEADSLMSEQHPLLCDEALDQERCLWPMADASTFPSAFLDTSYTDLAIPGGASIAMLPPWTPSSVSSYDQPTIESEAEPSAYPANRNCSTLHRAVASNNFQIVCLLLQHGSSVNALNSEGMTPLHLAVKVQNVAIIQLLISHEADMHCLDSQGRTVLDLAVDVGNPSIVGLLLAQGAVALRK